MPTPASEALLAALEALQQPTPAVPRADPHLPRCRKCGVPLALTSPGFGQASVDQMNLSSGVAICQVCAIEKG